MNQPGTAAYLAAMRCSAPDVATLLTIELTIPSTLTLRFSTRAVPPINGHVWEDGLQCDPITDAVEYLGTGPNTILWNFHLANKPLANVTAGAGLRLDALLAAYQWRRAKVTLYSWEMSLTNWSDALTLYQGVIADTKSTAEEIACDCTQLLDWDATVPTLIDAVTEPNAPDASLSLPFPIVLGDHRKPVPVPPFSASNDQDHDQSGGGRLAVPLIVTDPGAGAAAVKATAAGHKLKKLFSISDGHAAFVQGIDATLAPLGSTGVTETLTAAESYLLIDDGVFVAYAAVQASQAQTDGTKTVVNTADNPRYAMTPFNLSQFATIDQTASKNRLVLMLPDVSTLGTILGVEVCVGFMPNTTSGTKLRAYPIDIVGGSSGTSQVSAAFVAGTAQVVRGSWDSSWWSSNWQFTHSATKSNVALAVDCDSGTTQKASIYWAVLIVKYQPNRTLVSQNTLLKPYHFTIRGMHKPVLTPGLAPRNMLQTRDTFTLPEVTTAYSFDAPLYANCEGAPDDGNTGVTSGTFTGTAGALIERPPDLIRWLLATLGGIDATTAFEVSAGGHGSFVDMRTKLLDGWPDEFRLAPYIGQQGKLSDAVKKICEQSLTSVFLDRFTGLWRLGMWKVGDRADYDHAFSWLEIDLVSATSLTNIDAIHEVRVQYGYDFLSGRTLWEGFVSPAGSSTGYSMPGVRDQLPVTIGASNDQLDFKLDATTYSGASIAHATYANMIDLAAAVRTAMETKASVTNCVGCGWGYAVKASYNDTLLFTVSGTPYTATLRAGNAYTPDTYAIEVQRALNAAGSPVTFTVKFVPTTGGFTITGSSAWAVADDGAGHLSIGWLSVGYATAAGAATSRGTDYGRFAERFWWALRDVNASPGHTAIRMLWGSGAHIATCPHAEMGFQNADTAAAVANCSATYARSTREAIAAAAASPTTGYGPSDPDQVPADYINDEASALRLRNRRFDLRVLDRVVIVFRTTYAPDLQRLRHIQFDATLDPYVAFPRYGSDGSWAGKVFKVIGVTQYPMDSQVHQEITAIEV